MVIAMIVVSIFFIIKFNFNFKKEKINEYEFRDKLAIPVIVILTAIIMLIICGLSLQNEYSIESKINKVRKDNKKIEVLVCDRIQSYDDLEGIDVERVLEEAKEDPKMMELINQYDYNNKMIKKYKKILITKPTKSKTKIDFYKSSNKFLNEEISKQLHEKKYNLVNVDTTKIVEKTVDDDVVKALVAQYYKNSRFIEKHQKYIGKNITMLKIVI